MTYVDGFVLPVPKKKLKAYRKMAAEGARVWKKHGALEYFECVGDDLFPDCGGMTVTRFTKMAKTKPGETVVFAFIVYKSRAHRDSVNKKVMKQFEKDKDKHKNAPMPFDPKRMAYGGFKTLVQA
jgi:alkaline phosphatase